MLELSGVSKTFNRTRALQPIELTAPRGRTTVLIGPSGCGKSTLLRLMMGLIRPDTGSVRFEGTEVTPARSIRYAVHQRPAQPTGSFEGGFLMKPPRLRTWRPIASGRAVADSFILLVEEQKSVKFSARALAAALLLVLTAAGSSGHVYNVVGRVKCQLGARAAPSEDRVARRRRARRNGAVCHASRNGASVLIQKNGR